MSDIIENALSPMRERSKAKPGQGMQQGVTIRAGLVGYGIGKSLTPEMHEAEGRAKGLRYIYDRLDTSCARFSDVPLSALIVMAETAGFAGLNITHPFKAEVIGLVHRVSDIAQTIGAVNTVILRGGARVGHNSDYAAFQTAFRQRIPGGRRDRVLLLGAGGAGAAVSFGLIDEGVGRLAIYDQTVDQAEALAHRLSAARPKAEIVFLSNLASVRRAEFDGVVNATPMGMANSPGMAIDLEQFTADAWVADIVYFPLETDLLRYARQQGRLVMDGSGMAIHQAVEAFQLITGHPANAERVSASFARLTTIIPQKGARLQ